MSYNSSLGKVTSDAESHASLPVVPKFSSTSLVCEMFGTSTQTQPVYPGLSEGWSRLIGPLQAPHLRYSCLLAFNWILLLSLKIQEAVFAINSWFYEDSRKDWLGFMKPTL